MDIDVKGLEPPNEQEMQILQQLVGSLIADSDEDKERALKIIR